MSQALIPSNFTTDRNQTLCLSKLGRYVTILSMFEDKVGQPTPNLETILEIKEHIFAAWILLPPQHRATITMALTIETLKNEWGEWFKGVVKLWQNGEVDDFLPLTVFDINIKLTKISGLWSTPQEHTHADFIKWMAEVDVAVWQMIGCSVYDLPDHDFRFLFTDEVPPRYAAEQALINAGLSQFE